MPEMQNNISVQLRNLRKAHGLTQKQLADYLGVNRSTYTYYETGKTIPSVTILLKISSIYRVTLNDIAGLPDLTEGEPFHMQSTIPQAVSK